MVRPRSSTSDASVSRARDHPRPSKADKREPELDDTTSSSMGNIGEASDTANLRMKRRVTKTDLQTSNESSSSSSEQSLETVRPKRKATNAHFFRYLQTRNPSRLEEEDLRKALEASLEECPDYWQEDAVSCSSSEQSNTPSSIAGNCLDTNWANTKNCKYNRRNRRSSSTGCCSRSSTHICSFLSSPTSRDQHCQSTSVQSTLNHLGISCSNHICNHNHSEQCSSYVRVHRRYRPVAKKNIYNEADYFHDGIMEYIEYELMKEKGLIR